MPTPTEQLQPPQAANPAVKRAVVRAPQVKEQMRTIRQGLRNLGKEEAVATVTQESAKGAAFLGTQGEKVVVRAPESVVTPEQMDAFRQDANAKILFVGRDGKPNDPTHAEISLFAIAQPDVATKYAPQIAQLKRDLDLADARQAVVQAQDKTPKPAAPSPDVTTPATAATTSPDATAVQAPDAQDVVGFPDILDLKDLQIFQDLQSFRQRRIVIALEPLGEHPPQAMKQQVEQQAAMEATNLFVAQYIGEEPDAFAVIAAKEQATQEAIALRKNLIDMTIQREGFKPGTVQARRLEAEMSDALRSLAEHDVSDKSGNSHNVQRLLRKFATEKANLQHTWSQKERRALKHVMQPLRWQEEKMQITPTQRRQAQLEFLSKTPEEMAQLHAEWEKNNKGGGLLEILASLGLSLTHGVIKQIIPTGQGQH